MKYRNEIILAICFVLGLYASSIPNNVADYAEQSNVQSLATTLAQTTPGVSSRT